MHSREVRGMRSCANYGVEEGFLAVCMYLYWYPVPTSNIPQLTKYSVHWYRAVIVVTEFIFKLKIIQWRRWGTTVIQPLVGRCLNFFDSYFHGITKLVPFRFHLCMCLILNRGMPAEKCNAIWIVNAMPRAPSQPQEEDGSQNVLGVNGLCYPKRGDKFQSSAWNNRI